MGLGNKVEKLNSLDEVKKLNPEFDINGWRLTNGKTWGEYENYCLTSSYKGLFLMLWLDSRGVIIPQSKEYVRLLVETKNRTTELIKQMKNEMCKPIDINFSMVKVWDTFDKRNKSIKEKEKGLRRLLIKREKIYVENGGKALKNKLCLTKIIKKIN